MHGLPLRRTDDGPEVADLQQRLRDAGFADVSLEASRFDQPTETAVRQFQASRGLETDGVCGHETWSALIEAGYQIADRNLYLTAPMLRGDDVADLQRRLGALGFDAGRVDGIFGPDTASAVQEFQRNVALTADGICGRDTFETLQRLGGRGGPETVAGVRERERLLTDGAGASGPIVLGDLGGAATLADATRRELADQGLDVVVLVQPDASGQATSANRVNASCLLGLSLTSADRASIAYFSTEGFTSIGGKTLAGLIATGLQSEFADIGIDGMRVPLLRESRMPAVFGRLGPTDHIVGRTHDIAGAIGAAIITWLSQPVDDENAL